MAGQRFTKLNRGPDNAKARRRRQLFALIAAASTIVAAAIMPLATAPAANAGPICGRGGAGGSGGQPGEGGAGGAAGPGGVLASRKRGTAG
jgi:hypothetical protein